MAKILPTKTVAEWGLEYHGCSWNDISRFHPLCVDAKSGQYRSSTSNLFGHCEEIQERFIQGIVKENGKGGVQRIIRFSFSFFLCLRFYHSVA